MELLHKKGDLVPLRGMPEEVLNDKILNDLAPWLSQLLAIDDNEKNISRLEVLLPMIKESAWSMSVSEIKKAFLMYAKGELSIEPRDNYLTAILFSKVINTYKQQRREKPQIIEKPMISEKEIKQNAIENIWLAWDEFEKLKRIPIEFHTAFDELYNRGILPAKGTNEKIDKKYDYHLHAAHLEVISPLMEIINKEKAKPGASTPKLLEAKKKYGEINRTGYNHTEIQKRFRIRVLEGYFAKTTKENLEQLIK